MRRYLVFNKKTRGVMGGMGRSRKRDMQYSDNFSMQLRFPASGLCKAGFKMNIYTSRKCVSRSGISVRRRTVLYLVALSL